MDEKVLGKTKATKNQRHLPLGHSKSESCASVTPRTATSSVASGNSNLGFIWKKKKKERLGLIGGGEIFPILKWNDGNCFSDKMELWKDVSLRNFSFERKFGSKDFFLFSQPSERNCQLRNFRGLTAPWGEVTLVVRICKKLEPRLADRFKSLKISIS